MKKTQPIFDKFIKSMNNKQLAEYICNQINVFFPDPNPISSNELLKAIKLTEDRALYCFYNIRKKYFNEEGVVYFNHLISDQYCMYLYMLSNHYHRESGENHLPTKLYLLNKALHGVDIYFTTNLPDIFLLVHPIGTILGRATFSDYFIAYQGVTVGCLNSGIFPTFKGKTIMYANSTVLGECIIGDNVCISAGSSVINKNVPPNTIVLGQTPNNFFRSNNKSIEERPPFKYG